MLSRSWRIPCGGRASTVGFLAEAARRPAYVSLSGPGYPKGAGHRSPNTASTQEGPYAASAHRAVIFVAPVHSRGGGRRAPGQRVAHRGSTLRRPAGDGFRQTATAAPVPRRGCQRALPLLLPLDRTVQRQPSADRSGPTHHGRTTGIRHAQRTVCRRSPHPHHRRATSCNSANAYRGTSRPPVGALHTHEQGWQRTRSGERPGAASHSRIRSRQTAQRGVPPT